jgi:hypothetical protein
MGPIYIHEEACGAFTDGGFPEELRGLPMVFRGHLRNGEGVMNRPLGTGDPEALIGMMFENAQIAFIAIQNQEAGCYIARIERA